MKKIKYLSEYIIFIVLSSLFRCLPLPISSFIGGAIGRIIGPLLPLSKRARINIMRVFPHMTKKEHRRIEKEMWDNLGRLIAEYPHLSAMGKKHTHIISNYTLDEDIKHDDRPIIFVLGHLANWEIAGASVLCYSGKPINALYRAPNNPYMDQAIKKLRTGSGMQVFPKSRSGSRQMIRLLRQNKALAILIDQKYNKGIWLPFLGFKAKTSPAFAELALKYKAILIPVQIIRRRGVAHEIIMHTPVSLEGQNGNPRKAKEITAEVQHMLEEWIRANPGQWLWIHRRWPEKPSAAHS